MCLLPIQIKLINILSELITKFSLRDSAEDTCQKCGITNDFIIKTLSQRASDLACHTFRIVSIMVSFYVRALEISFITLGFVFFCCCLFVSGLS